MPFLTMAEDEDDPEPVRGASPSRGWLACGAALLPKIALVAVATFLALDIGAPWLLFDAPPSPFEGVALKALCRNATGTKAACQALAADPVPATLRVPLR